MHLNNKAIQILLFYLINNLLASEEPTVQELTKVYEEIKQEKDVLEVCNEKNANNSFIYCSGPLLAAVNIYKLFNDSKTFVDKPMKNSPNETLAAFNQKFGTQPLDKINAAELKTFVDTYFDKEGSELDKCELNEWQEKPPALMRIRDPKLRTWALKLNNIWKDLCRKVKPELHADRHSLIPVPQPFVVPGGRFREFYYWDAYWIILGLRASGMRETIKNMITNFVSVVERFGFVPNGGRVYYLARSQPPMLIPMAFEYYDMTHDIEFIKKILPSLIRELQFWNDSRRVDALGSDKKNHSVYQYRADSTVPRPESYRIDLIHALPIPVDKRQKYYQDTASAAESGWDFSSRWFKDKMSIETIQTTDIAEIDLNAFICLNMDILSFLLEETGSYIRARDFNYQREEHRYAMRHVFFNETLGTWFDRNLQTNTQNMDFYPSTAVPLFAECYQPLNTARAEKTIEFLNKSGAFNYRGGVPTSAINNDQQWDFPNGWSPLNHMIVEGMRKSIDPYAQEEAFKIAQKWIRDNYRVFEATGFMWEKYNVTGTIPAPGVGGEYNVQEGFGWTNGVALNLLATYYDRLTVDDSDIISTTPKFANAEFNRVRMIILILITALIHSVQFRI